MRKKRVSRDDVDEVGLLRPPTHARRLVYTTHNVFHPCTFGFLFKLSVFLVLHGLAAPFFLAYHTASAWAKKTETN